MRRVSGEEFEPHRRGALRLGWRHESGAHGWHNNVPSPAARLVLQPEARRMRCLLSQTTPPWKCLRAQSAKWMPLAPR